jgi:Immunoglobulin-like domain of bacterial spore germination
VESTDSSAAPAPTPEPSTTPPKLVVVDSPTPGALISSPVRVTGRARGSMYFEAEFPVRLLDDHETMIGTGVARAQGEWTTSDYVPFEVSIVFHPPLTDSTGTLVFEKSNPSGQPDHAAEWRVAVRFR